MNAYNSFDFMFNFQLSIFWVKTEKRNNVMAMDTQIIF